MNWASGTESYKMTRLVIFAVLCFTSAVLGRHEKYEGHQLYRVSGNNDQLGVLEAHLQFLSLKPAAESASGKLEAVVALSPENKQRWLQYFHERNMIYTKVADNLADMLRDEESKIQASRSAAQRSGKSMTWDTYYKYDEINDYLDELGAQYPDLLTVVDAGYSYEGRLIKYVKISTTGFQNPGKPVIVIDAMVHSNEWVTTPVAMYTIHQLVVDIVDSTLTEHIDWVIVPLANPDGYVYTWEEDRLWRKTRSKEHAGADECPGVDGNRNFDHHWGTTTGGNISSDPCSHNYHGPSVFSEVEIRIIRDVVLEHLDRTPLYYAIHSWGSMILYAWGQNGTLPSNGLTLHVVGVQMANAMHKLALEGEPDYIVGNAAQVLYFTSGTSRDWTRAVGIPLTYTLELPAFGYAFVVPPEYIKQIVTELWAGIVAGAYFILQNGY